MSNLSGCPAKPGILGPVLTIEMQILPKDADRIRDAVMQVHPLRLGRHQGNAGFSAPGKETASPEPVSTTDTHVAVFDAGTTETCPVARLKTSN